MATELSVDTELRNRFSSNNNNNDSASDGATLAAAASAAIAAVASATSRSRPVSRRGSPSRSSAAADGEPKCDQDKTGIRAGKVGGRPLVQIDVPKGVWALLSLSFACSVTLLYVNIDMRSINIDEFKQIKNVTVNQASKCHDQSVPSDNPVVWVHGRGLESGYLRHVVEVFQKMGYDVTPKRPNNWDVLWAHDYPFSDLSFDISHLKPNQRVNHVPGTGYITNKVSLATGSQTKHIPKAFRLPKQKQEFLAYAAENKNTMWVQKSNSHRGIVAKRANEVNVNQEDTFVQELIVNPLLVDGYKFDIGIYTILTSLTPLRVYTFDADALLRFCAKPYDRASRDVDSYVVGDDYLPIWDVPSLKNYFTKQRLSMKDSLNLYLRQRGLNPDKIWTQINEAISSVFFEKQRDLEKASRKFPNDEQFFEMFRFDFLVDEHLNVYLLEANMSPNLSSAHFKQNARLYEQVVYNMMSVTGLATPRGAKNRQQMTVTDADLAVYPGQCAQCAKNCRDSELCSLCFPCMDDDTRDALKDAFLEHVNRQKCRRVIPLPIRDPHDVAWMSNPVNKMMYLWFEGKCQMDESFCT